ncbi:MAG: hypothetical protein ACQEXJ_20785 [Myxococcota bacterium]
MLQPLELRRHRRNELQSAATQQKTDDAGDANAEAFGNAAGSALVQAGDCPMT